jgi:hypothetical protein
MKAYITSTGLISPQATFDSHVFPATIQEVVSDHLTCIEPDYRSLINPLQLRRMPRILKMGLAAAQLCIRRCRDINPDAIIVGTGLGCLENLEKFLLEVLDNDEKITSVLPFINSTHNAVAAQVAMLLNNHNYNLTYCHRGFSFECALFDALMLVAEKQAENILVGGIDECTDDFMLLHRYLGWWKEPLSNLTLLEEKTAGTIAGEGSAFFMLSAGPSNGFKSSVDGIHTFLTPEKTRVDEISAEIDGFVQRNGMVKNDIDLLLTGLSGDILTDGIYHGLQQSYLDDRTYIACFKPLCGEYYTASSFALWLAFVIMEQQQVPDVITIRRTGIKRIDKILIYNNVRQKEHTLMLLSSNR